jgi:uncharacterized protein
MTSPTTTTTVAVKCFPGKLQMNELEMLGGVFSNALEFDSKEEDGSIAYLKYDFVGLPKSKLISFAHTWTPEKERGKGLAKVITKGALEWAKKKGYTVIPTCSYVEKFARENENEEYVKGVVSFDGKVISIQSSI